MVSKMLEKAVEPENIGSTMYFEDLAHLIRASNVLLRSSVDITPASELSVPGLIAEVLDFLRHAKVSEAKNEGGQYLEVKEFSHLLWKIRDFLSLWLLCKFREAKMQELDIKVLMDANTLILQQFCNATTPPDVLSKTCDCLSDVVCLIFLNTWATNGLEEWELEMVLMDNENFFPEAQVSWQGTLPTERPS